MSIITAGQSAPEFSLSGIDGKTYTLKKNGARLTLAVFFKTTCPTCVLAWPYVEKIHQTYRGVGLRVWGISPDPRESAAEFARQSGSTFPILDDSDWRVSKTYDPEFVPTLVLIDDACRVMDSVVAFDKNRLNHLSQVVAGELRVPAAMIALEGDGNPAFKPG